MIQGTGRGKTVQGTPEGRWYAETTVGEVACLKKVSKNSGLRIAILCLNFCSALPAPAGM